MNKIKNTILLLVCSFGLMFSQFANATIMTSGCVSATECSLDELVNGGGSLSIDDVAFTNWQETVNIIVEETASDDNNYAVDLSAIFVAGIDSIATGNPNEFILGVKFFTVSGMSLPFFFDPIEEAELELDVEYNATASDSSKITATKLQLGDRNLGSDDSFVEVNLKEPTLVSDGTPTGTKPLLSLQVVDEIEPGASATVDIDEEIFDSAQTGLALNSNIQIGTFVDGDVELFDFSILLTVQSDDPITSVPEPSGVILLLLSLTLLMTTRYRKNL